MHGGWLGWSWQRCCWCSQAMAIRSARACSGRARRLGHWLYDAAAWPAENLSRVDTRSLLPSTPAHRTTKGAAAEKATRFISWQQWLKVPSDTRYRQLQARTPHARTVRTIVACEILLPPGLILLLLVWRWCSGGPLGRLKPSTAMGSARWATAREIRALRPRGDGLGFVLGYAGRALVSLPEKVLYQNVIIIGPPGVGKSVSIYEPDLLEERGTRALVIVDVKGELTDATYCAVARRHDAMVLNFVDPTVSIGYNPLAHITSFMEAELFGRTWVNNTGTSKDDSFWDDMARQLITAAVLHLLASMPQPSLQDVAAFLCGQDSRKILAAFAASPSGQAKEMGARLLDSMHKNERLAGSVFAGMPLRFSLLQDERVRAVTGTNELDFARFVTAEGKPPALYVVLDYTLKEALPPLTATFFTQFFRHMRREANTRKDKRLPRPILVLLDEFGTVGHIAGIHDDLATMRSARLACVLAVQGSSQIAGTYGRDTQQTILTTCMTKIAFPGMDEDAKWFSERLGLTTVLTRRADASRKRGRAMAHDGTDGLSEHARPLLTADEVTCLGEHELLVLPGPRRPLRLRQRRAYQDRRLRRLMALPLPDGTVMPVGGPKRATPLGQPAALSDEAQAAYMGQGEEGHARAGHDERIPASVWTGEYLEQEAPVDQEQAAFQVQALQETWQGDAEERTPDRTIALEAWDEDEALARTGARG